MLINNLPADIESIAIAHESGISFRTVGPHTYSIDYGVTTDHLQSDIVLTGTASGLLSLRASLAASLCDSVTVSGPVFGPQYAPASVAVLLSALGDVVTVNKGVGTLGVSLVVSPYLLTQAVLPVALDLSRFAVQAVAREHNQSAKAFKLMSGATGVSHGWQRPELTLNLQGKASDMGAMLNWLQARRATPFSLPANMVLIDSTTETVVCTSFSGLAPLGNSGRWNVSLNLTRAT